MFKWPTIRLASDFSSETRRPEMNEMTNWTSVWETKKSTKNSVSSQTILQKKRNKDIPKIKIEWGSSLLADPFYKN